MSHERPLCPMHGVEATGACTRCGAFRCAQCPPGPVCPACQARLAPTVPPGLAAPGLALAIVGGASALMSLGVLIMALTHREDPWVTAVSESWRTEFLAGRWVLRVVSVLAGIVSLLGGLRMREGRSRPLAIAGAILALPPIINACICVSTGIGIWALIVLLRPGGRAAFSGRE